MCAIESKFKTEIAIDNEFIREIEKDLFLRARGRSISKETETDGQR